MKALTLLPEKVKKDYHIVRQKGRIAIHSPAYVNVDFDKSFFIDSNENTCHITNSKIAVTLWRSCEHMHISVF